MGEIRTIGFSVDGEWLTDFVRTWFWDENKPYETCENLLLQSLMNPDIPIETTRIIIQDIIEGRKKLVGINEFELVDDNENIRPLSMKLNEQKRVIEVQKMKMLMDSRMILFVDPYSIVKSLRTAKECGVTNYEQCMTWFWYEEDAIQHGYMRPWEPGDGMLLNTNDDTELGLWLYYYPEIVYDAFLKNDEHLPTGYYKEGFWKAVYEIMTDEEHRSTFSSKYFARRNENYLASLRMKEEKDEKEETGYSVKSYIQEQKTLLENCKKTISFCKDFLDTHEKPDEYEDADVQIKYHTIHLIYDVLTDKDDKLLSNRELMYQILPDNYEKWEGLISPNGDFYSCDFGGHNAKAYHIMTAFPEKFPNFDYENNQLAVSEALDDLLSQGWCATRYLPTIGNYIELPRTELNKCTKAQKDAIFDAKVKHNVEVDLNPIGY